MARRRSYKALKSEKPRWYCIPEHYGDVRSLAASGMKLSYVTDPRDIAGIWKYLGNPAFRVNYDYLLINNSPQGVLTDIYAVKLPKAAEGAPRRRSACLLMGDVDAFSGDVDRICYGWASAAIVREITKSGKVVDKIPQESPF